MITKDDHIVCAFAEPCAGPGWVNTPIWVIVQDGDKKLRKECIQPEEQTPEMRALYGVSAASHKAMTEAVRAEAEKRAKQKKVMCRT